MTNEEEKSLMRPIESQEWFQEMLEELKAIKTETGFNARMEIIKGKWLIGDVVFKHRQIAKNSGYGDRYVPTVAEKLGISTVALFKMLQFKKLFPSWEDVEEKLPQGKAISWRFISNKLLSMPDMDLEEKEQKEIDQETCKHSGLRCLTCGKKFKREELCQKEK